MLGEINILNKTGRFEDKASQIIKVKKIIERKEI